MREVTELAEQLDLAALGFRFNTPGFPKVIGPIGVFETGAYLTQSLFDYHAIERKRGATYNEKAAQSSLKERSRLRHTRGGERISGGDSWSGPSGNRAGRRTNRASPVRQSGRPAKGRSESRH